VSFSCFSSPFFIQLLSFLLPFPAFIFAFAKAVAF
jgi:hypothetical protein